MNYIENIFYDGLMDFINDRAEEIRIRINKPAIVIYPEKEIETDIIYTRKTIDSLMERITKSSIYAFSEDIKNGFITVFGGHRIGISGTAVYEDGELKNIRDISYINVRIAHELKGVGEGLFAKLFSENKISNTLIISPPGAGKTTLLRDLIRLVSDNFKRYRVAVIDERNEISASFLGEPQNDIGKRTDVLCGYKKKDGIIRAIRSMSPDLIALDEIGSREDTDAIIKCKYCGVNVIATMHGDSFLDAKEFMEKGIFKNYILIDKKTREITLKES